MQPFRALLLRHRAIALVLAIAALCLKAAMPAGYMLGQMQGQQGRVLTVVLCSDASGQAVTHDIVLGNAGKAAPAGDQHAKAEPACPWSALAFAALGGVDAPLLVAALAFILALGFAPFAAPQPPRVAWLLPPLRGPPIPA
ncbi:MAG: hypothetical protein RLZZ84_297 [Pseudomonadota bacterium]|jgi:hypothetical protein